MYPPSTASRVWVEHWDRLLLHTAYNRRSDPLIQAALEEVRAGGMGKPLGATLVSRCAAVPH